MRPNRGIFPLLFAACLLPGARPSFSAYPFDLPEPTVQQAPDSARSYLAPAGTRISDLDVCPSRPEAALLEEAADGTQRVLFWDIATGREAGWPVPNRLKAKSLAWHPAARSLFLLARAGDSSYILSLRETPKGWTAQPVHATAKVLRRLVPGPRPFSGDSGTFHRIFTAEQETPGIFSTLALGESGKAPYYAIGTPSARKGQKADYDTPSEMAAKSSLPMAFHPAGHLMIWETADHCFEQLEYAGKSWGASRPLLGGKLCGGSATYTPNGLGLLHWQPGIPGVELILSGGKSRKRLAGDRSFAFTPSCTPDGRGLVGIEKAVTGFRAAFVPVELPLADVVNAWMFAETGDDLERFSRAGGLFRTTAHPQMFSLYETENYACDGYEHIVPTRPYLVTTDAIWEVWAAAFEGLFVTAEKQIAIPSFWEFIRQANLHFHGAPGQSRWGRIFASLEAYRTGAKDPTGEAARIDAATGSQRSPVLDTLIDFDQLVPRGNYASSPAFQRYYKAFSYLTRLVPRGFSQDPALARMPLTVRDPLGKWLGAYRVFISGSRAPLAWNPTGYSPPAYLKHPETYRALFPLSWAMDNEILNSLVYHPDWPEAERILGPDGPRIGVDILDLPAALGNPLAATLSAPAHARYPRMAAVMADLRARPWRKGPDSLNLYQGWMGALADQWGPVRSFPSAARDWSAWEPKRLQTGLSSWATLRHATILVNDVSGAECGEGGFEDIIMRPPRGYVEPDPVTFRALAGLFEKARLNLERELPLTGNAKLEPDSASMPLRKGLADRLRRSSLAAARFAAMAEAELQGKPLHDSDYAAILEFGRMAEHHFLLYKSLSNEGLGLPSPDPIPKIADVAKLTGNARLFAAVGHPLEWNQIVPYFGRRQAVKGAVYSFYSIASDSLFTDKSWQVSLGKRTRPDWISRFVIDRATACPAKPPF